MTFTGSVPDSHLTGHFTRNQLDVCRLHRPTPVVWGCRRGDYRCARGQGFIKCSCKKRCTPRCIPMCEKSLSSDQPLPEAFGRIEPTAVAFIFARHYLRPSAALNLQRWPSFSLSHNNLLTYQSSWACNEKVKPTTPTVRKKIATAGIRTLDLRHDRPTLYPWATAARRSPVQQIIRAYSKSAEYRTDWRFTPEPLRLAGRRCKMVPTLSTLMIERSQSRQRIQDTTIYCRNELSFVKTPSEQPQTVTRLVSIFADFVSPLIPLLYDGLQIGIALSLPIQACALRSLGIYSINFLIYSALVVMLSWKQTAVILKAMSSFGSNDIFAPISHLSFPAGGGEWGVVV